MSGPVVTPQVPTDAGLISGTTLAEVTPVAAQEIPNPSGNTIIIVETDGGSISITVPTQQPIDPGSGAALTAPTRTISVGSTKTAIIGPFPKAIYNLPNGNIQVNIDTPANIASMYVLQVVPAV